MHIRYRALTKGLGTPARGATWAPAGFCTRILALTPAAHLMSREASYDEGKIREGLKQWEIVVQDEEP